MKYGHTTKQFTPVKNVWNLAALASMGTSENHKVMETILSQGDELQKPQKLLPKDMPSLTG